MQKQNVCEQHTVEFRNWMNLHFRINHLSEWFSNTFNDPFHYLKDKSNSRIKISW